MADSNPQMTAGEETEKTCWQCGRIFVTAMEVCPDDGARLIETGLEDKADPLVGTIFDGRFEITRKLGEGGMGTVYSARRLDFESNVALKLLKVDFARDDGIRKRFMYEARVISNLRHPHAVRLYDFGQTAEGHVYMVMELLEGESLADRLSYRFVSYREAFDIITPVCGVLGEAHTREVIHRDLKPENIYLLEVDGNEEFPKLLDFGIAKHNRADTMTKSGTLWGTPAYMSPEQASGDAVGASADIYGIGIMLFELISGNLPFHASTQMGYAVKHINEVVRPMSSIPGLRSVPEELDELLVSMLAKDPAQRPASMDDVATALTRISKECFDDDLLDSVPAQEVDPIGLQRWMKAAPDISQELPAEEVGELHISPDLLAETSVIAMGSGPQDDDQREIDRAFSETAEIGELDSAELQEFAEHARSFADTEALTQSEVEEVKAEAEESSNEKPEASSPYESARSTKTMVTLVVAAIVGMGVLGGGLFLLSESDGNDEVASTMAEAIEEMPETSDETAVASPEPVELQNVAPIATSHALTVVFQAFGIIQQIDPEIDDEEFEEDFDFLYGPGAETAAEQGLEGNDEVDDDANLREALENTF